MNWEYISGFFDADGSVTAIKRGKNENKSLQISFHNTEVGILDKIRYFIACKIGVMGSISRKPAKKITHNDSYDLKYTHKNALIVANMLQSTHPKKIHRIKIYNLIQQKTKRNGKYTPEQKAERDELIEQFFKH